MDSSCEQGSQNSTCSQNEPELELLRHFVKAVDFQYGVQNSRLSEIESLMKKLIELRKTLIPRSYQNIFNEYVLKYLEICLEFLTHCGDATIMEQKKYSTLLLNFIPEFFQEPDLKNTFVKDATVKILDLFMYGPFNNLSKKSLLNLYNTIASQAHPQVLVEVSENILYYMYKLMDCLSTYGDYLMQSDIMKTLYRIFGSHIANKQLQYEFLPGSEQLSERLAMEISVDNFNADVRRWLNKFNNDSKLIFSMPCEALIFGSITCKCPNEGPDAIWVDFDLKDCVLSFYSLDSNGTNWNRIMIMANDVQKVEVTGQFKSSECTTISLQLSKPCISESPDNQEYWNSLDKHFKMIINGEQKAKINKLLVHILPPLFEDKFLRTSSRVPTKIKNVYKPLRMKTSKRKSTSSESSSKSKSDVNLEKYSVIQPEPPKHSVSQIEAAQSTVAEEKQSKLKPSSLLRSDVSVVISDFTNNSSRASVVTSDTLSIISVKSSAVFESRPSSADLVEGTPTLQEGNEKLQDNIVTSSHGINDDLQTSIRIEILSGQFSGGQPVFISETTDFEPSEIFASSPVKRSKQIIRNLSDDDFYSAHSETSEKKEDLNNKKNNHVVPKISALAMFEDISEEFATAEENLSLTVACKNMFNNVVKEEYKAVQDTNNRNKKISQYTNQNYLSKEELVENSKSNKKIKKVPKEKKTNVIEDSQKLKLQNKSKKISAISNSDKLLNKMVQNKVNSIVHTPKRGETKSTTDKSNFEILSQDLFEIPTQLMEPEREDYSEANPEAIFSLKTLEFRDESIEENFTGLSLAVNVGVSDNHHSDKPAVADKRKVAINNDTYIGIKIIPSNTANKDKNKGDINLIDESAAKFADQNKEDNIIDLTDGENDQVKRTETSNVIQNRCFLNTPELLDVLTINDSQPTVLKENEKKEQRMPIRKKKERNLIRTGRKQFCLEEVGSELLAQSESDNYNKLRRTIPISDIRDETSVLGITESQVINVSRTHSIISIESSNDTENVNLITTCNQSKNQDEEHILSETSSMSGFIEKKTAKLLISESESDILEQSENRIGTEEISQASGLSDFIQKQVTKRIISESHTDIENVVEKHQESESEEIPIVEENDSTDSSISQNEDRKSIDPFDLLLADTAKPIKVKIISNMQKPNEDHFQKRTVGTKTRKLYNPGNLSYLDAMQVAEQSTPEIKTSPIHIKKGAKVHKQKKPRTKKPKEVSNTSKENSVRNKTKDSFKREIKKRKPIAEKRDQFFIDAATAARFKELDELFDKSCMDIMKKSKVTGVCSKCNKLDQSKDVIARSAHPSSSGKSPDVMKKSPKIRILQNILITHKRPIDEETTAHMSKKFKLEVEENISLPNVPECLSEEKGDEFISDFLELFDNFIKTWANFRQDPNSVQKLKRIYDHIVQLPKDFFS